jgi:L-lysine exporter family protein LysE/ArgO
MFTALQASDVSAFTRGLALCFGLIVAIGAQNTFVLRQGLRSEHVWPVVLFCSAADALLVFAGVAGMSQMLANSPALAAYLAAGGAVFLFAYAAMAMRRALHAHSLQVAGSGGTTGQRAALGGVMLQLAAFTFLNPHVYLDTLMLMGSVGAAQPGAGRWFFVAGAASASLVWFASLGFGARLLAPWLNRPNAWRWLDASIALMMAVLGALVARQAYEMFMNL